MCCRNNSTCYCTSQQLDLLRPFWNMQCGNGRGNWQLKVWGWDRTLSLDKRICGMLTTSWFSPRLVKNWCSWLKHWRKNTPSSDCNWMARKRKSWRPLPYKRHHMWKYVDLWLLYRTAKSHTNIWAASSLAIWMLELRWNSCIAYNVHEQTLRLYIHCRRGAINILKTNTVWQPKSFPINFLGLLQPLLGCHWVIGCTTPHHPEAQADRQKGGIRHSLRFHVHILANETCGWQPKVVTNG